MTVFSVSEDGGISGSRHQGSDGECVRQDAPQRCHGTHPGLSGSFAFVVCPIFLASVVSSHNVLFSG